jgi:hypothetical protein
VKTRIYRRMNLTIIGNAISETDQILFSITLLLIFLQCSQIGVKPLSRDMAHCFLEPLQISSMDLSRPIPDEGDTAWCNPALLFLSPLLISNRGCY